MEFDVFVAGIGYERLDLVPVGDSLPHNIEYAQAVDASLAEDEAVQLGNFIDYIPHRVEHVEHRELFAPDTEVIRDGHAIFRIVVNLREVVVIVGIEPDRTLAHGCGCGPCHFEILFDGLKPRFFVIGDCVGVCEKEDAFVFFLRPLQTDFCETAAEPLASVIDVRAHARDLREFGLAAINNRIEKIDADIGDELIIHEI